MAVFGSGNVCVRVDVYGEAAVVSASSKSSENQHSVISIPLYVHYFLLLRVCYSYSD